MPAFSESGPHRLPFVHDDQVTRSLQFTPHGVQSLMCCQRPFDLEVAYTKTMMGFLLVQPHPVHILMIGLGGGSLAKFCYQHLPQTRITVVEINPHVIAMRQQFLIPADDARLRVVCADGVHFVRDAPPGFDVILVDGFDDQGLSVQLCTLGFYEDCRRIMTASSVLAVNLDTAHPEHAEFTGRIDQVFNGHAVAVDVIDRNNSILFAGKRLPMAAPGMSLRESLGHHSENARAQLTTEFQRILPLMASREPLDQGVCMSL